LLSWSMTLPVQRQWPAGTVGPGVTSRKGVPPAGGVALEGSFTGLVVGTPAAPDGEQARAATARRRNPGAARVIKRSMVDDSRRSGIAEADRWVSIAAVTAGARLDAARPPATFSYEAGNPS